jgi:hypothetical protein
MNPILTYSYVPVGDLCPDPGGAVWRVPGYADLARLPAERPGQHVQVDRLTWSNAKLKG